MSKDLEAQLKEMGPGYEAVVDRLLSAYRPAEFEAERQAPPSGLSRLGRLTLWGAGYLAAASLVVAIGLGVTFRSARSAAVGSLSEYRLAEHVRNEAALQRIILSQNEDGSWQNDFLTRQNALALKNREDESSRIAYKKAMRNLRCRGLL